jgi:hypothetical protein
METKLFLSLLYLWVITKKVSLDIPSSPTVALMKRMGRGQVTPHGEVK